MKELNNVKLKRLIESTSLLWQLLHIVCSMYVFDKTENSSRKTTQQFCNWMLFPAYCVSALWCRHKLCHNCRWLSLCLLASVLWSSAPNAYIVTSWHGFPFIFSLSSVIVSTCTLLFCQYCSICCGMLWTQGDTWYGHVTVELEYFLCACRSRVFGTQRFM